MYKIKNYLKCGNIYFYNDIVSFRVSKTKDLHDIIIPMFERNTMYCTNKQMSFDKWKIVINMIHNKDHLIKKNQPLMKELAFNINGEHSKGRNFKGVNHG